MIGEFLRTNLLWSEGYTLSLCIFAVMILSYLIYRPVFWTSLFFFFFCLWFFRFPKRDCPECVHDKSVIVCPADGKVVDIQFGDVGNGFAQKVTIFLSLFDAHVMWMPVDGIVSQVVYTPGTFSLACLPKSSLCNERNDVYVRRSSGGMVLVRQIAGTIARRIRCWVAKDDVVQVGQPFGMIRFGSCVELFLPKHIELTVGKGQLVIGGQTVIGRWLYAAAH